MAVRRRQPGPAAARPRPAWGTCNHVREWFRTAREAEVAARERRGRISQVAKHLRPEDKKDHSWHCDWTEPGRYCNPHDPSIWNPPHLFG